MNLALATLCFFPPHVLLELPEAHRPSRPDSTPRGSQLRRISTAAGLKS